MQEYLEEYPKWPHSRTSLVIEWLRLFHTPNAGGQRSILVRELDPSCCN